MLLAQFVATLCMISITGALPSQKRSTTYALKERHNVPRSWTKLGPSSKRDLLHLQIGLAQQSPGLIEQHLLEISDPKHERYGKHLSQKEVDDIVTPSKDTTALVESWLQEHGITEYYHNKAKTMIHCAVPISTAETLLNTTYHAYKHEDGTELNRASEWSLPEHLHCHIDLVQPTTSFFYPKKQVAPDSSAWHDMSWWQDQGQQQYPKAYAGSAEGQYGQAYGSNTIGPQTPHSGGPQQQSGGAISSGQANGQSQQGRQPQQGGQPAQGGFQPSPSESAGGNIDVSSVCQADMVTSQCRRTLYGTIDYVPQAPDRLSVATANYLNETVIRSDISAYMQMFRPDASNAGDEINIVSVSNGDINQQFTQQKIGTGLNKEANLDAQNLWSMVYPIPLTAYHTGGSPPFQASLSTAADTNEPYLDWLDYVLGQENLPQVISTSYGDDEQTVPKSYADRVCQGFAQLGARGITLILSSGDNGVGKQDSCVSNDGSNTQKFLPTFPGTCPWVTSVGATEGFQPEVAVTRFASGGGFSNYFEQPDYQRSTVQNYIQSLNGQYQGLYNTTGRGFPDVAAQGDHDAIVWNGAVSTIGGTSASAPTFAGVIALVNDALIAAGRSPLGFLNPWLYSEGYKALTDVVSGSSYGCNTLGFPAQQGWDAVTGFGTPNFSKLVQAALNSNGMQDGQGAAPQQEQQASSEDQERQQ